MNALCLVAKETFLRQVKSWSFLMLVLAPFLTLGLSFGVGYLTGNSSSPTIALVTSETSIKRAFASNDIFKNYASLDKAKKDLKNEDIQGYMTVDKESGSFKAVYHSEKPMDIQVMSQTELLLNNVQEEANLKESQLSDQQLAVFSQKARLTEAISDVKANKAIAKQILFFGTIFLLYMFTLTYASVVAQEIASEKGTKIMEVILSSVPAPTYFYGRMLGIFVVILTHLAVYVIGGALALSLLPKLSFTKATYQSIKPMLEAILSNMDWNILLLALFGTLLFVVLAALCGSLVVRIEDAGKAVQPVLYLVILGFIGASTLGNGGDGLILQIGSYLPFLSTFFMPVRLINGYANSFEGFLAVLVLIMSNALTIYYIGRSYAGLILQTDDISLLQSLKRGLTHK